MSPNVWIPNRSYHNYRPAEEFGTLQVLTSGQVGKFSVGEMFRKFELKMKDSTENDFLIITSLPYLNVVASAILGQKHQRYNLLIYDPRLNVYRQRSVDLSGIKRR